jgi:hypothetical protein
MFYNEQHQNGGVTYLTPGQSGHGCVTFYGDNMVSYDGVTMLVPLSAVPLMSVSTAALVSGSWGVQTAVASWSTTTSRAP